MVEYTTSEQAGMWKHDVCDRCELVFDYAKGHGCPLKLLIDEVDGHWDHYDWESAFSCASGVAQGGCSWSKTPDWAVPDSLKSPAPAFDRTDVAEVLHISVGEKDERDWLLVGRLKSGLYFFLAAGCDYSGWDCQSDGRAYVGRSLDDVSSVITTEERIRLTSQQASTPAEPANDVEQCK